MNSVPKCVILPSLNGDLENCVQMNLPSTGTLLFMLVISWVIFMIVAYIIYRVLNKSDKCVNYWAILGILILAGIIVSLLSKLFRK